MTAPPSKRSPLKFRLSKIYKITDMKITRLLNNLFAVLMLLGVSATAFAQDMVFSIDKTFLKPGETTDLAVNLKNAKEYVALNATLTLPQGLSFVITKSDETGVDLSFSTTERTKDATVLFNGNEKRGTFFISNNLGLEKSDGAVIKVAIKADDTFAASDKIDFSDMKGMYKENGIQKTVPGAFTADVYNTDFEIAPSIDDINIKAGETKTVKVNLDFDEKLAAFEYMISLPEGLSINKHSYKTTDRTPNHQFFVGANGKVAVVAKTADNSEFVGATGALFTFDVTADETFKGNAEIVISDVKANSPADYDTQAMTKYYGKDIHIKVSDQSTTGINGIDADTFGEGADGIYQLNGVRTDKLQRGVNIVVKNGKAVKVVKK